ncbi:MULTISPECIES: TetR/AcrR family transcriptional regulator [Methylotenera]|uniref:TetR/AcrR family transcriptional regulator n=1 Tax=Methylotenera TaxID=359407 RepID=UPI000375B5B6|nr:MULTISPECIES: TetR/AcrR family transcriptional regulator [Methylotenera]
MQTEKTITESMKPPAKPRGRPLAFNQDNALEAAMLLFWAHGYEGTSMAELTNTLGINKPSIYAAFGNKEELFRKAIARYIAGPVAFVTEVINAPTAYQVVEKFLKQAVEFFSDQSTPNGCLIVQAALTCGQGSSVIQQELVVYRKRFEMAFVARFELAKAQGDLPQDADANALAKYLATIHQGLSVQATSGATKQELLAVVGIALKNWQKNEVN